MSATSDTTAFGTFRVVHQFDQVPGVPHLFKITVTVTNQSLLPQPLLYRRVMDWDAEPTAFTEYVTVGNFGCVPTSLVYDNDDGFSPADPLGGRFDRGATGMFTDYGPGSPGIVDPDNGAMFDFDFGLVGIGGSRTFEMFYGAAPSETIAIQSLQSVGAQVYSLGQPSNPGGAAYGRPVTFMFGFRDPSGGFAAPMSSGNTTSPSGAAQSVSPGNRNDAHRH